MISLKDRLDAYERLLRLHQPIGTLLLLWPTLSALWLATAGRPPLSLLIIFAMGTLLMRSAGCAFNDWVDRDIDRHVARTQTRPLTQGVIAPWEALAVAAALSLIAFCFVWFTTRVAIGLSVVALALALLYPFFKRFFSLPQAFLGIAFSFGIPMAFAAANDTVPWHAWILMGINLFWVVAYDTEYAMADRADDLKLGLRSSAITFGRGDVLAVAVCYGLYLSGMVGAGLWRHLGMAYWLALVLAAVCAAYHLWLIRTRDPACCFAAFRHNHWLGMAIFVGIVADYALRLHAWPVWGR